MFEKAKYKGYSVDKIKQDLQSQGYNPVLITEAPNSKLEEHSHPANHILVVKEGGMVVKTNDTEYKMQPGDKITINSGATHAAAFGSQGCKYLWIEY